jgi:hypothetical protein
MSAIGWSKPNFGQTITCQAKVERLLPHPPHALAQALGQHLDPTRAMRITQVASSSVPPMVIRKLAVPS